MDMNMKMNMNTNATGHNMTPTHDMNNMGMNMGMNMQMYFVFSSKATILFEEWDIDSVKGMVWSCVVVFLMAVLYEGFKVFRELLRQKYKATQRATNVNGHVAGGKAQVGFHQSNRLCNWHHVLQSFLHMIQVAVSYFLMLIAMTFNGWLFISVCVGAGVGYFLFSWAVLRAFDLNEHCH